MFAAFSSYSTLSRITVALPLSAGKMVMSLLVLSDLSASCSPAVMLNFGGLAFRTVLAMAARARSSLSGSAIHFRSVDSTLAMISSFIIRRGACAKFRPF